MAELTVLVPDHRGRVAVQAEAGMRPVRYTAGEPVSDEAEQARVLVVYGGDVEAVAELMRRLPRLELVQTLTAGYDQWVPVLPPGVALSNGRGAHGGSTAEWVVASTLALLRELPEFGALQRAGHWEGRTTATLLGATVLVLGAGDLGVNLRERLLPFGADVTLAGRSARDGVTALAEVDALLPSTDVVVVLVPLSPETRGLVDAAFLARMRDGAILVNAARGPVVDTAALLAELTAGRLRAALDVTDPEPLPDGHPLWSAPGVLVTPHVGGNTEGWQDRAWAVAVDQLRQFARGARPDNQVV